MLYEDIEVHGVAYPLQILAEYVCPYATTPHAQRRLELPRTYSRMPVCRTPRMDPSDRASPTLTSACLACRVRERNLLLSLSSAG